MGLKANITAGNIQREKVSNSCSSMKNEKTLDTIRQKIRPIYRSSH
jgi:hypothetical protein